MGPTSLDVGGSTIDGLIPASRPLQWGRHLSMSEGSGARTRAKHLTQASMGPTSLDVGGRREPAHLTEAAWEFPLQWGRHLSMSEGDATSPPAKSASRLQWGRHLSMSEGGGTDARFRRRHLLQWGRHLSMSEGGLLSRGPTSGGYRMLQWGRHLSMSEGDVAFDRASIRVRFNGADISRCRRAPWRPTPATGESRALQWGRHLSMSEGGSLPALECRPLGRAPGLQWGRHLSMSEGKGPRAADVVAAPSSSCFNGADISRCRRVSTQTDPNFGSCRASMGPTSLDVGGAGRRNSSGDHRASMGPTSLDVGGRRPRRSAWPR